MIKMIGIVCVLFGAGGFGVRQTLKFVAQRRQLASLRSALELLKCEMNYTVRTLPMLCRSVRTRIDGPVGSFFGSFAELLEKSNNVERAAAAAVSETHALELPQEAVMALLEVCTGLGRYDLDGANRILSLALQRIDTAIERCEQERRPLARSYILLSLCAGAAVVILSV